eukprot:TRINITY_DN78938_c0_g1_i1.p1 TRINITY_DN78938_c0_g1~~TRINITY_DN78938_c0_g1_i1.p1  ORF type:complete len:140 (-),score=29.41 TRINITY_DN78938_c0_g1_i1:105-461(-)
MGVRISLCGTECCAQKDTTAMIPHHTESAAIPQGRELKTQWKQNLLTPAFSQLDDPSNRSCKTCGGSFSATEAPIPGKDICSTCFYFSGDDDLNFEDDDGVLPVSKEELSQGIFVLEG